MNRLVIAEKPSVGKAIAAVLGAHGREDGCFIGNGYIVSWCFGHLAELAAADTYDEKYGKRRNTEGEKPRPTAQRARGGRRGKRRGPPGSL